MLNRTGLQWRTSNYVPLSPVTLLSRTADVHLDQIAVCHGDKTWTYQVFRERCLRLGAALALVSCPQCYHLTVVQRPDRGVDHTPQAHRTAMYGRANLDLLQARLIGAN